MASKASSLAIELKTIKSELRFMQERCALLEEENRRLRDGVEKGDRPEEDDLVIHSETFAFLQFVPIFKPVNNLQFCVDLPVQNYHTSRVVN